MVHGAPAAHDRHYRNTNRIAARDPVLDQGAVLTTTHRTATTALLVVSLAAASAPMAGARPADYTPAAKHASAVVYSRQDKSIIPATVSATSGGGSAKATAPPPTVRVTAGNGGFDWGDAGIGAAGGIALAMAALGGALGVTQRRARRTWHTTAALAS